MVGIFWTWNPVWYVLIFILIAIWLPIFLYRKSWKRKGEWKKQIVFAIAGFLVAVTMEGFGITMDAWHYTGGDWPAVLFIFYFFGGFTGFQIYKIIDERLRK